MKFTKTIIAAAIALNVSHVSAEWTVNAVIKNETAYYTQGGSLVGDRGIDTIATSGVVSTTTTPTHSSGDVLKSETSARIFLNGTLGDQVDAHLEIRPVFDSKAIDSENEGHEDYSQRDFLREAYIDATTPDGTLLRIGKQQIVWGKADGAKFMDLINPTDYREMAQNTMDESRIPVWSINAEKILADGSSIQAVLAQPKENIFAGLNRNISTGVRSNNSSTFHDSTLNNGEDLGHSFMLLGVDSIVGQYNGFLNIAPDLGGVAGRFAMAFGGIGELSSPYMAGFTLDGFEAMTMQSMAQAMNSYGMLCGSNGACSVSGTVTNANFETSHGVDWKDLPDAFESSVASVATALFGSNYTQDQANSITGAQMLAYGFQPLYNTNLANVTSDNDTAFDFMGSANFRTFDTFVNAKSRYTFNMPSDFETDKHLKWSKTLGSGANVSFGYSNAYDKNPIINLSWRNDSNEVLHKRVDSQNYIIITDASGNQYGGNAGRIATLQFEQALAKAQNFSMAGDYSFDTDTFGTVVLRGEGVYTAGAKQPVIDKGRLAIGDLVDALTMEDQDRFRYVIGADVTALTDMMVSIQFIQERNLDYINTDGYSGVSGSRKYTTDYATMHLSNGFQKAHENKEFYSVFLSKPFGESGNGRWNDILMLEEGGGRWNRFDVEYSLSNELVGTFEVNKYWGDTNTQFGQLENSSNIQVGLKYIIE